MLSSWAWAISNRSNGSRWCMLYALAADLRSSEIIHSIKVFDVAGRNNASDKNSHSSPTSVIDEGRVYVHFGRNSFCFSIMVMLAGSP